MELLLWLAWGFFHGWERGLGGGGGGRVKAFTETRHIHGAEWFAIFQIGPGAIYTRLSGLLFSDWVGSMCPVFISRAFLCFAPAFAVRVWYPIWGWPDGQGVRGGEGCLVWRKHWGVWMDGGVA